MAGRKPTIGDTPRTKKFVINVTPDFLDDFKIAAFLKNRNTVEHAIALMQADIDTHSEEIKTARELQRRQ